MGQYRITTPGPLLDGRGALLQRGYATRPLLDYQRAGVKAPPWRVKEWDFYQVSNDEYCVQFTIGHASYAGQLTVTFFRFSDGLRFDRTATLVLPFNSLHMPSTASAGETASRQGVTIGFRVDDDGRWLRAETTPSRDVPAMRASIKLSQRPGGDSMVIATPFLEYPQAFYYNEKINCLPADGFIEIGDDKFVFSPDSAFGLLDWGRGVWPFHTEWYWGNGSTIVDGVPFGFNIGYGFGDASAASENMLFYGGVAHKLSAVTFDLAAGGYMAPKHFSSDDGRFDMDFTPVYDRITKTKLLFVDNECHQVFGRFSGTATLDDGHLIDVRDMMAFTEHAVNNW
jgi:hypothetical protein